MKQLSRAATPAEKRSCIYLSKNIWEAQGSESGEADDRFWYCYFRVFSPSPSSCPYRQPSSRYSRLVLYIYISCNGPNYRSSKRAELGCYVSSYRWRWVLRLKHRRGSVLRLKHCRRLVLRLKHRRRPVLRLKYRWGWALCLKHNQSLVLYLKHHRDVCYVSSTAVSRYYVSSTLWVWCHVSSTVGVKYWRRQSNAGLTLRSPLAFEESETTGKAG